MTLAVAAAVIVAYGILVLDWSVFVVVALFWFENVVIGVLNVAKMLVTGARIGSLGVIAALALARSSPCITDVHGRTRRVRRFAVRQAELGGCRAGYSHRSADMLGYLLPIAKGG